MKEILDKYIKGNCTKEEFERAISTLKGESAKTALDEFMRAHWKEFPLNREGINEEKFELALHRIHHLINVNDKSETFFKKIYTGFSKVAAIIVLPLMLALVFYFIQSKKEEADVLTSMSIPAGVQGQIDLPDGSKVWLNSGSNIKFPNSFGGKEYRHVELRGEGFFQVASNKKQPFIVNTGNVAVEVLGTSFNVCAYDDDPDVWIALLEGSVQLTKYTGDKKKELAQMQPMQVARYVKTGKQFSLQTEKDLDRYIAWKDGKLVYMNEPFDSVLRQMGRRYSVDYVIEDKMVLKHRITATFIHQTLDEFLKIIALSTPIEYRIIPGEKKADGSYEKRKVFMKERKKM